MESDVQTLDPNLCIICGEVLQKGKKQDPYIKKPTVEGLQRILHVAQQRDDEVHKTLFPYTEDIISFKIKVSYHVSCRANYSSKTNINEQQAANVESESISPPGPSRRLSRRDTQLFDIRRDCFICGKARTRPERLTAIMTGTGKSTRDKVLHAASERLDEVIHHRLITYPDLFAYDAKYHKSCLAHYISERNIAAAKRKKESDQMTIYDKAFVKLTEVIDKTVFSKEMKVMTLNLLTESYDNILKTLRPEEDDETFQHPKYKSWKLKEKLLAHYKQRLVFVERAGKSDMVCSESAPMGYAMREAAHLQENPEETTTSTEDCETQQPNQVLSERQILHRAADILRRSMEQVDRNSKSYFSSDLLSRFHCSNYVPNKVYDFVNWCVDSNAHRNCITCDEEPASKENLCVIAICHDLIAQCCHIHTPITLGLAILIHHEFGSKTLIDELSAMGHCASYTEVRHFLTSVAAHEISRTESGVYIPSGLTGVSEHGIVDAAIDNFDQNEDTLDGKQTTHAMASVVFRRCHVSTADECLPRVPERSLSTLNTADWDGDKLHRYIKPQKRPEPPELPKPVMLDSNTAVSKAAEDRDLVWKLSRNQTMNQQYIPAWSAFNAFTSDTASPVASVLYMPFIRESPSDLSTIYTAMIRLVQLAEELGQHHILVTADLAIYGKAQQILWSKPELLHRKITMRLGGMHITMAFLASIGKLYGDGGLFDILTESGVYAEGTARQLLQGKQLARGIRSIKLVSEALFRLFWKAMQSWLKRKGKCAMTGAQEQLLQDLQHAFHGKDKAAAQQLIGEMVTELTGIQNSIQMFTDEGEKQSATFRYWLMFLKGADLLLRILRSEREADFQLHLNCMCEVMTWFRAAGRTNYAKYMPVYVAEMKALEHEQPEAYTFMQEGGFVVRHSEDHNFNCVATDQALEQTINREGKSQGGVVGFTLCKAALTRWLMTRHVTTTYVDAMKELCDTDSKTPTTHKEHGASRMARDEEDIHKIMESVEQKQSPYDLDTVPEELINIASGQVASEKVAKELSRFLQDGAEQNAIFVEQRLAKSTKTKSFWDPEKRKHCATFKDMKKSSGVSKSRNVHMDSDVLFRRLFAVSKQREVSMEYVMSHELAAVPTSLFYDDGSMRKTTKADLAKKIESVVEDTQHLPSVVEPSAYIIDGMALLQSLPDSGFQTFNDLGEYVWRKITTLMGKENINSVAVVFDRYDHPHSIKDLERQRRGTIQASRSTHVITGNAKVPNYRKYLRFSGNKAALCNFVSRYIANIGPRRISSKNKVILAGGFENGEEVKVVSNSGVDNLMDLYSDQEEADTRLVFHAIHAAESHSQVIIRCDDTDVLVLLVYYSGKGAFGSSVVFMHSGHDPRERFVPVCDIAQKLGAEFCSCLPACHALTGCDTTSSLYRVGKATAFTRLKTHLNDLKDLANFGLSGSLEETIPVARKYVLLLYGRNKREDGCPCTTLDELRYTLASTTDSSAANLPPTEDAFQHHVSRAMYQTAVWCHSHEAKPQLWNPVGRGWRLTEDGSIEPVMSVKAPAPKEVRDITHLYCKDGKCSDSSKCQCLSVGLTCTEFCSCPFPDCPNIGHVVYDDNVDDV